jgi:hypothetical protein
MWAPAAKAGSGVPAGDSSTMWTMSSATRAWRVTTTGMSVALMRRRLRFGQATGARDSDNAAFFLRMFLWYAIQDRADSGYATSMSRDRAHASH